MWHAFSKAGPGTCGTNAPDSSDTARLPEPWLLQEAYENLLLTFHPQTQHRATYHSGDRVLIEPMLALYCPIEDRKSTRLNSSHQIISYAVFCLKKKTTN